ncbi:MAG: YihY/virulence factor BrkB family protein [Polyangiaceae bacterium]
MAKSLWLLSKDAYRIFADRGARLLSASIAFYALLSVGPILIIAVWVASLFVESASLQRTLHTELTGWVGAQGATTLVTLAQPKHLASMSTGTGLLGIAVLIYASTRLFAQLTRALDLLWNASPLPKPEAWAGRVLAQVKKRAFAFSMVLLVGLLLIVTTGIHAALAAMRQNLHLDVSFGVRLLEAAASFLTTVVLFFVIFRVLPRTRVRTMDALVGSAVTALLFTLGSLAVTAYVSHRDVSVYGAASAIVMLMLWAHYNAHAFFLGAAFTAAHANRREKQP